MKFNCGKDGYTRRELRIARLIDWHTKFAWVPIQVGPNDCRWLEFVSRKGTMTASWDGLEWEWEYLPREVYYC